MNVFSISIYFYGRREFYFGIKLGFSKKKGFVSFYSSMYILKGYIDLYLFPISWSDFYSSGTFHLNEVVKYIH